MNVEDLIEHLRKMPQSYPVLAEVFAWAVTRWLRDVVEYVDLVREEVQALVSCLENRQIQPQRGDQDRGAVAPGAAPVEGTRPMRDALQALGADLEDLLVHLDRFAGRRVQSDEDRHELTAAGERLLKERIEGG